MLEVRLAGGLLLALGAGVALWPEPPVLEVEVLAGLLPELNVCAPPELKV